MSSDLKMSWNAAMEKYSANLSSSSTSRRIQFLKDFRMLLATAQDSQDADGNLIILSEIGLALLKTYNYYQDTDSRNEVVKTLVKLVQVSPHFLLESIDFIHELASKQEKMAVRDYLTLLQWTNELSMFHATLVDNPDFHTKFILSHAMILERCVGGIVDNSSKSKNFKSNSGGRIETLYPGIFYGNEQNCHLKRIYESVTTSCTTSISKSLTMSDNVTENVDLYVQTLTLSSILASSILSYLGLVASACEKLTPTFPALLDHFHKLSKDPILKFLVDKVILGKDGVEACSLNLFGHALPILVDVKEFSELILPALEKSILRSSETSLAVLIPNIVNGLEPESRVGQAIINSRLLVSILNGFQSLSEVASAGAFKTLNLIVSKHCNDLPNDSSVKLVEECIKFYKRTSSKELKAAVTKILSNNSINSTSENVLESILPLVSKEQNEITLATLVEAFVHHYFNVIRKPIDSSIEKYEDQILSGLKEKKLNLRSIWFAEVGEHIRKHKDTVDSDSLRRFIEKVYPLMIASLRDAQQSPLQVASNKGILCSYVVVSLHSIFQTFFEEAISNRDLFVSSLKSHNEKPSLLLSPKIISKVSGVSDVLWLTRALSDVLHLAADLNEDENLSYGIAWLYTTISSNISYELRLGAHELLKVAIKKNEGVLSRIIVKSMNEIVSNSNSYQDLEPLALNLKFVTAVISVVSLSSDLILSADICKDLLIISNNNLIPVKNGWVGVCQRANVDVGQLVKQNSDELVESCFAFFGSHVNNQEVFNASIRALCTLSFIQPEIISPKIALYLEAKLDIKSMDELDKNQLEIWKGQEGELVVNVLEKQGNKKQESKNSRDYETRKWEEEMRRELANKNKNKTHKKLNSEEQRLVNEQLEKETKIRQSIQICVDGMKSAIQLIDQLIVDAVKIDNGCRNWYPLAIQKLLSLAESEFVSDLLGSSVALTYLKLSEIVSNRLSSLRKFIGIATFRMRGLYGVDDNMKQEPIISLISRILFRVKFLTDQNSLDSLSLSYVLPLLTNVLQVGKTNAIKNSSRARGNSEFVEEDPEEEHLLLALDILSAHSEVFEDDFIPKRQILEVLISLMKLPSKAKNAKECFLSLCQHISVNISKDDLLIFLENIISPETFASNAILEGIDAEFDLSSEISYSNELWIMVHSTDQNSSQLASTIWEDSNFQLPKDAPQQLLEFAGNENQGIRLSVALAITSAVKHLSSIDPAILVSTVDDLINLYNYKKNPPPPKLDKFGLPIKSTIVTKDLWEERSTVAKIFKYLAPMLRKNIIERFFRFLVDEYALGDKQEIVRQELQEAGIEIIKIHGPENVELLIPVFEACLSSPDDGTIQQNHIRESVIILYGALARHLEESDSRLEFIIERMMKTLDTPSEDVQFAISECIAPLVHNLAPKLQKYFNTLFDKLFNGEKLAHRRGAAYGISGLVKGVGIKSLAEYNIIRTLSDASEDKKNPRSREGVLFVFECLSQGLGKYFEPYVIEVLPIILKSYGDQVPEVRDATDSAAKQIMKSTTSYGIKNLIPVAVSNLDDIAWRSKKGSVELLGSMAYLDPTQLSASLSTIVPEIVGVLNDTHKEVRKAADQALKRFGEVIRNPEIQAIVPDLINAIGDPTKYTDQALDKLIKTQFVHYIDGPSLALIIHVIHRGMRDRSASTKKKACRIVGNMAILVDNRDLGPYLPSLIDELEVAMVDPVASTRSTAARAIGSLVEKLGEERFPDLIPRLLQTLQDESKTGDRLGSAQALAEVICGLGTTKLEELLPVILSSATSNRSYIRAGFMPLLLYLPVCFGSQFAPYLSRIIPCILSGLADNDEDIRDTALRAGKLIVKDYAKKAIDLLLPELENGLSDSSYRIRLSSVQLTGDLLFRVTGISGKNELSGDLSEQSMEVNRSLLDALGQERRDKVLSALFLCRSDVASVVRGAALDIWKALVVNTPRTVKEIMPTLTHIIVRRLASSDDVQRTIAALTLGEMIRRVGANALSQLLPTLEEAFMSSDNDAKQGICIALTELIKSTQEQGLIDYQDTFIRIITNALTEPDGGVREAAAQAFESLQEILGKVVIDKIIPHLLNMLDSDDSESALLALEDIMSAKAEVIFPILIPTLLSPPMDAFKSRALASLASVAGPALFKRLSLIINTLVNAIIQSEDQVEVQSEIKSSLDKILLSVEDGEGAHPLIQQLLSLAKHEDSKKRAVVYQRLAVFFSETNLDYSIYVQDIVSQFVLSLGDKSSDVVKGTFEALSALVKRQSKESLEKLIKPARQSLSITGVKGEELEAFALPRGPNCVLPIFLHGLMYGNTDQRESSALAIADVIDKTPAINLKPFATSITGPLIRVIGEKVSSDIKTGILQALTSLLSKIPQFLRPFIPQLQRTFVRSLSDPQNDTLRSKAVIALGTLIVHQPRVDSLVTELVTGAKNASEQGVKTSMVGAMLQVVNKGGKNMSESSKGSVLSLVEEEISSVNSKSAVSYAKLLGSLSQILSPEEAAVIIETKILNKDVEDIENMKFAILSINSFLRDAPHHIFETDLTKSILKLIINCSESTNAYVSDNATVAIGKVLLLLGKTSSPAAASKIEAEAPFHIDEENSRALIAQLSKNIIKPVSNSLDTRRLALVVVRTISRFNYESVVRSNYDLLVPSVFSCLRDVIIPIKLAAEKAYLAIFNLVNDVDMKDFNEWFSNQNEIKTIAGATIVPRSIGDYTKRVAARLANVERERIDAGGDYETLFSDRVEDEIEVWSVGGVEISNPST